MKKFIPHLIAIVAFMVMTFAYFGPIFSGKELKQQDINNWKGMAKEIMDVREKTGEEPLWTNSMFGGMPAYQISVEYPANIVRFVDKVITLGLPAPANYFFLFCIGFYFLLLTMGVNTRVAIIGAFAFAFSTYFIIIIDAGHNSKAHAIGYIAPIVAGLFMTYRGKLLQGVAVTGLALALQLYANHLQITYYTLMMVGIYFLTELYSAIKEKRLAYFGKATAFLAVAALIAASTNITNLMATQEYGKYSTRGPSELTTNKENQTTGLDRDYITDWSYGVGETFTMLVPDFKGGASEPISINNKDALKAADSNMRQYIASFGAYFGDQPFTSGPVYVGAIIILLFVIGLFVIEGPVKWWIAGATLLSLMLSWGKNFMSFTNFFLDHVPGYDKFRAVSMILVIAEFTIPLLAILTVNKMLTEENFFSKYKKKMLYGGGIVIGLTLLMAIAPGTFTSFYTQQEYDQVAQSVGQQQGAQQILDQFFSSLTAVRSEILVSDAIRSLMLVLIAGILIFTFVRYRYNKNIFIYGLLALVLIDLGTINRRYLESSDFVKVAKNDAPWQMNPVDIAIKQDTAKSYRVLNLAANTFNDASTSYYHQSIGGYHGAKLKRYKELIDSSLTYEMTSIKMSMQKRDTNLMSVIASQPALNMLNTKYFIYDPQSPPLENPGALGNAWFVNEIKTVDNADQEIVAVRNFNPKTTAIVDKRFADVLAGYSPSADSSSSIVLTEYKPHHLTYSSSSSSEQLAVFSEIYYDKGWNAYVDGNPAKYVRADYVLRAMRIPAGNHKVEWKFEPEVYSKGEKVSLAGSSILILFCGFVLFTVIRKKPEQA